MSNVALGDTGEPRSPTPPGPSRNPVPLSIPQTPGGVSDPPPHVSPGEGAPFRSWSSTSSLRLRTSRRVLTVVSPQPTRVPPTEPRSRDHPRVGRGDHRSRSQRTGTLDEKTQSRHPEDRVPDSDDPTPGDTTRVGDPLEGIGGSPMWPSTRGGRGRFGVGSRTYHPGGGVSSKRAGRHGPGPRSHPVPRDTPGTSRRRTLGS